MHLARALGVAGVTVAALVVPAGPALAFHHVRLPASECAGDESGGLAGGNAAAVKENNPVFFPDTTPEDPPLPPASTPAEPSCPE